MNEITTPVQLLVADDHQVVIDGIKSILEDDPSVTVVAEALNGKQVIDTIKNTNIDIAIIDINMPVMDGVEVTKILKQDFTHVRVLILTMYNDAEFIKQLMEVGADGFILKNTGRVEILTAIEQLKNGDTYFGQEVTQTLSRSYHRKESQVQLTRREKEVLQLLADGLTTSELADKLFISKHTADSHRKNLLSKFDAKNIATLLKLAVQKGFVKY